VIFSRGRGRGGRHHKAEEPRRSGRHAAAPQDEPDDVDLTTDDEPEDEVPGVGPYDVADAPDGVERLDLGSLRVPAVDGVEIRVQAGEDGTVQQVVLVHGDSALQLGVFAAPRSEGIWDEVRDEIKASLKADGVAAQETEGEYGAELRARVRGPEGTTELRFIGIDGPRWMVRAVYQGPAALDPAAAGPLTECLRGLVVDRGKEAMPVREALPLRLPKEVAEQAQAQQEQAQATQAAEPATGGTTPANGARPGTARRRQPPRRRSG
jgi:Protein of unknown function (DUF3710)